MPVLGQVELSLPVYGNFKKMNEANIYYGWAWDWLVIYSRYFVIAGIAYFLFYTGREKIFGIKKLQNRIPNPRLIRKEIRYSMISLSIYCLTSLGVYYAYYTGWTQIYLSIEENGWAYFFLSIIITLVLHDAYFYWTHRLLHIPRIFKSIHRTHHLSHSPDPWSAFSFHPIEAIISVGIIPLIVFLIPIHPYALFIFLTIMTLANVNGHLGFELFSKKYRKGRVGQWQNTASLHDLHHARSKNNYGLYFTFWDRIMKTFNT